jgi:hypothetical protein
MPRSEAAAGLESRAEARRAALLAIVRAPGHAPPAPPSDVLSAVWQVTAAAWALAGRELVEVPRHERVGVVHRGSERSG